MTKYQNDSMKVTTVNLPKIYLRHIRRLCDKENASEVLGFEASISEYVRHAVKDKIMRDNNLELFFQEKRKWQIQERMNKLEKELTLIKVPYNPSTKRKPLGNIYYNKGMNEA